MLMTKAAYQKKQLQKIPLPSEAPGPQALVLGGVAGDYYCHAVWQGKYNHLLTDGSGRLRRLALRAHWD